MLEHFLSCVLPAGANGVRSGAKNDGIFLAFMDMCVNFINPVREILTDLVNWFSICPTFLELNLLCYLFHVCYLFCYLLLNF